MRGWWPISEGVNQGSGDPWGGKPEGRHWGWQELQLPVMKLEEGRGREGRLNHLSSMVLETKGLPVNS